LGNAREAKVSVVKFRWSGKKTQPGFPQIWEATIYLISFGQPEMAISRILAKKKSPRLVEPQKWAYQESRKCVPKFDNLPG